MKKIICFCFLLCLLFSLSGCSADRSEPAQEAAPETRSEPEEAPVEEAEPDAEPDTVSQDRVTQNIEKVTEYLYEATCDNYEDNFALAQEFFEIYKIQLGGCSAVQVGVLRGRNYDWTYDETTEFVVHVPATETRHASVGVAAALQTMAEVDSGEYFEFYDILPYFTVDGVNDAGLIVNINVVNYGEKGIFSMKTEDSSDDVCPVAIPRLLLDQCGSIEECLDLMADMDIFSLGDVEEAHFLITGKQSPTDDTMNTVVVELIPDEEQHYQLSVIDYNAGDFVDDKPIMTNFHLTGFDGSVESLTEHPMGYERWQILRDSFEEGQTLRGMKDLMRKVYYTNSYDIYSANFWYSELAAGELNMFNRGEAALNGDFSKGGVYADAIEEANTTYTYAKRGESSLWHTVHTSIYDYEDYHLYILPQESGYAFSFDFEGQVNIVN